MSNKSLYRTAVVFSIITAMGWLLFILGSLSGQPAGDAGVVANYLARAGSTSILLYTWGGVVGSLAVIPVLLDLPGFQTGNRFGSAGSACL